MTISRRQFLSGAIVAAPVGAFLALKGNDGLVQFAADKPVPGPGVPRPTPPKPPQNGTNPRPGPPPQPRPPRKPPPRRNGTKPPKKP